MSSMDRRHFLALGGLAAVAAGKVAGAAGADNAAAGAAPPLASDKLLMRRIPSSGEMLPALALGTHTRRVSPTIICATMGDNPPGTFSSVVSTRSARLMRRTLSPSSTQPVHTSVNGRSRCTGRSLPPSSVLKRRPLAAAVASAGGPEAAGCLERSPCDSLPRTVE